MFELCDEEEKLDLVGWKGCYGVWGVWIIRIWWNILLFIMCFSILKGSGCIYFWLYLEIFWVNICRVFKGIWWGDWDILIGDFVVLRVIVCVGIFGFFCVCGWFCEILNII